MKTNGRKVLAGLLCALLLTSAAIPALAKSEAAPAGNETVQQSAGENTEARPAKPEGESGSHHRHRGHGRPEEAAEPENAIGKDRAKEIALSDAGLTSAQIEKVRARVSDKDGTLVYKVSFRYEGQRYSYRIDPLSGEILNKTVNEAAEHTHTGRREHAKTTEAPADETGGVV